MKFEAYRMTRFALILAITFLVACEAPLNLDLVEAEGERDIRRYDMFQASAATRGRIIVVSSSGAALISHNNGASWERDELPERPALIDVAACENGNIYALDSLRRVWEMTIDSESWSRSSIDTIENTLSIHCAPGNKLWVSASFSTLFSREMNAEEWKEFTLDEDLQFTTVQFLDRNNGYAAGEFGTVIATNDGGNTWVHREFVPNEFYPMGVSFADIDRGWLGGLDGVVWQTTDGGESWQRQETQTKAPIYNILAQGGRVFAAGGSGKLVELIDGVWSEVEGAPDVLAYLRALTVLEDGSLLLAGGRGTIATVK